MTLSVTQKSYAQSYVMPDDNFRNYINTSYPDLLNDKKELIIENARNFQGTISCEGLNISDLSGLQYFHKISLLNCSDNPLKSLPPLDSLFSLTEIYSERCSLTALPELSQLINLQTASFKSNKLSVFPALDGLTRLQYLDCSLNNLKELPDLSSSTNLIKLFCWSNSLIKLPDLSKNIHLQVLDCPGNNLTVLPALSTNRELQILRCGINKISVLPSIDHMVNLRELSVENNLLSTLPDLANNKFLEIINVSYNNLSDIPDLSGYSGLQDVVLNNNKLAFSELIPQTQHVNFTSVFKFIPQDTLLDFPVVKIAMYDSGIVPAGIDSAITTNTYQWFKGNKFIQKTTVPYLKLDLPVEADSGLYLCKVTNSMSSLQGLQLTVKSASVFVEPCINASWFSYRMISNSCMSGAEIEIEETVPSTFKSFTYTLKAITGQSEYVSHNTYINKILPGNYDLLISGANNCNLTLSQFITVPAETDCENVITPNGDGIDDYYYVEGSGNMKILNKEGVLIKQISIPGAWDGTDSSGEMVPIGLYTILINDKNKIGIVVLN